MIKVKKSLVLVAFTCVVVFALFTLKVLNKTNEKTIQAKSETAQTAQDFELSNLDKQKVRLSTVYQSKKATLVNFWATWCPPCRGEIPELVKVYNKYKDKGLEILAVNLREKPETVKKFAQQAGMNFPILADLDGGVGQLYNVLYIPTTYIVDRQGKIKGVINGGTDEKALENAIKPLLAVK